MKRIFVIVAALLLMMGCKETVSSDITTQANGILLADNRNMPGEDLVKDEHIEIYGIWTGWFKPIYETQRPEKAELAKKISLKINRIEDGKVSGISIIDNKEKQISGTCITKNGVLILGLDVDKGNKKEAGHFELTLKNKNLTGNWVLINKTQYQPDKTLVTLEQRNFVYDPEAMLDDDFFIDWQNAIKGEESSITDEEGVEHKYTRDKMRASTNTVTILNASTTKLTEEDLKNLSLFDLQIIRNTVYARHGYSFSKSSVRYIFEDTEWYVPVYSNVDKQLTKIEKQNIALLTRMEKYATDHYEYFGR